MKTKIEIEPPKRVLNWELQRGQTYTILTLCGTIKDVKYMGDNKILILPGNVISNYLNSDKFYKL